MCPYCILYKLHRLKAPSPVKLCLCPMQSLVCRHRATEDRSRQKVVYVLVCIGCMYMTVTDIMWRQSHVWVGDWHHVATVPCVNRCLTSCGDSPMCESVSDIMWRQSHVWIGDWHHVATVPCVSQWLTSCGDSPMCEPVTDIMWRQSHVWVGGWHHVATVPCTSRWLTSCGLAFCQRSTSRVLSSSRNELNIHCIHIISSVDFIVHPPPPHRPTSPPPPSRFSVHSRTCGWDEEWIKWRRA